MSSSDISFPFGVDLMNAQLSFPQALPNFRIQPSAPDGSNYPHTYGFDFANAQVVVDESKSDFRKIFDYKDPTLDWEISHFEDNQTTTVNFSTNAVNDKAEVIGSVVISFVVNKDYTIQSFPSTRTGSDSPCIFEMPAHRLFIFVEYKGFTSYNSTHIKTLIKGIFWFSIFTALETAKIQEAGTDGLCVVDSDRWILVNTFNSTQATSQNFTDLSLLLTSALLDNAANLVVSPVEDKIILIEIEQLTFDRHGLGIDIGYRAGIVEPEDTGLSLISSISIIVIVGIIVCVFLVVSINAVDQRTQKNDVKLHLEDLERRANSNL